MAAAKTSSPLNGASSSVGSKFGMQMLLKMGWQEGNGLGKNQQGISTHLTVTKKDNTNGLGHREEDGMDLAGNKLFMSHIDTFNSLLSNLNVIHTNNGSKSLENKEKKSKKRKRKADDEVEKEDKIKDKKNKKRKEAKIKEKVHEEERTEILITVQHRKQKILRAKNVKSYSSQDLNAILGKF